MPLAAVSGGSLNPVDFKNKVTTNVDHVIARIHGISPQFYSEEVILFDILKMRLLCLCWLYNLNE